MGSAYYSMALFGLRTMIDLPLTLFLLAVHTGMRRSELLGLRWRDVDIDMASLSVVQVVRELPGGRIIFSEPKTAKGRGQIGIIANLLPKSLLPEPKGPNIDTKPGWRNGRRTGLKIRRSNSPCGFESHPRQI